MIALHPQHSAEQDPVRRILQEPVSASRLNLFHSCRMKFYFRYILKWNKPASTALHVGKAVIGRDLLFSPFLQLARAVSRGAR